MEWTDSGLRETYLPMALVWIGFVTFFVVALAVGVRLALLWKRTGEWPELMIATRRSNGAASIRRRRYCPSWA